MDALPNDIIRLIYWHYVKCDTSRGFWRLADARVARLCEQPRRVCRGPPRSRIVDRDYAALSKSRLLQAAYDGHAAGLDWYYTRQTFRREVPWQRLESTCATDLEMAIAIAIIKGGALALWPAWRNVDCGDVTLLYYGLAYGREDFLRAVLPNLTSDDWFEAMNKYLRWDWTPASGGNMHTKAPRFCIVVAVQNRKFALAERYLDFIEHRSPMTKETNHRELILNAFAAYGHVDGLRRYAKADDLTAEMVAYSISNGDTDKGLVYLEETALALMTSEPVRRVFINRGSSAPVKMACKR